MYNKKSDSISREGAIKAINQTYGSVAYLKDGFTRADAIHILESQPPFNPEIIRCKDCNGDGKCAIQSLVKNDENFFCGDAVRRED